SSRRRRARRPRESLRRPAHLSSCTPRLIYTSIIGEIWSGRIVAGPDPPYGNSPMPWGPGPFDTPLVNGKTRHHRALADPTRARLLDDLRASEVPQSVD